MRSVESEVHAVLSNPSDGFVDFKLVHLERTKKSIQVFYFSRLMCVVAVSNTLGTFPNGSQLLNFNNSLKIYVNNLLCICILVI